MSASLRSLSKTPDLKLATIKRRLKNKTGGLGYLAARDAAKRIGLKIEEEKK